MTNKPPRRPEKKPLMGLKPQDLRALGIGLELAAVIGGAAWLGSWADGKLGTDPWLTMTGVILGICGGGWHALKMANDGKTPEIPGITKAAKKPDPKPPADDHESTDPGPDPKP
ncbi:MAG: AtpZ/AtpI family protein [Planctomycetota bacterium]